MKIRAPPGPTRMEVLQLVEIFRARVADVSERSITLCVTGDAGKARPGLLAEPVLLVTSQRCLLSSECMPAATGGRFLSVCDSNAVCYVVWTRALCLPLCVLVPAMLLSGCLCADCRLPFLHDTALAACVYGDVPQRRQPPWSAL